MVDRNGREGEGVRHLASDEQSYREPFVPIS